MKRSALYILQIGLAITFGAIGAMILQDPAGWGAMLQPWAAVLIPGSIVTAMRQTAILDIIVGLLFLMPRTIWIAALVGAVHLVIVIITAGINVITIRDIGLLAVTAAVFIETVPPVLAQKAIFWRR